MTVSVKFYANVRKLLGKEELRLDLDPSRTYHIKDIVGVITESERSEISTALIEIQGKSHDAIRVVINGKDISSLNGLETDVQDGDEIMIFPLLSGG